MVVTSRLETSTKKRETRKRILLIDANSRISRETSELVADCGLKIPTPTPLSSSSLIEIPKSSCPAPSTSGNVMRDGHGCTQLVPRGDWTMFALTNAGLMPSSHLMSTQTSSLTFASSPRTEGSTQPIQIQQRKIIEWPPFSLVLLLRTLRRINSKSGSRIAEWH